MNKKAVASSVIATVVLGTSLVSATPSFAAEEKVTLNKEFSTPSFIGEKWVAPKGLDKKQTVIAFLEAKKGDFKIKNASESFKVKSEVSDKETKSTHFRLQQQVNGVPVFGADQAVSVDAEGNVDSYFGQVVPEEVLADVATEAKLSKKEALKIATKAVSKEVGKLGKLNKEEANLFVYTVDGKATLAYVTEVSFLDPAPGRYQTVVDAVSGKVLSQENLIHDDKYDKQGAKLTVGKEAVEAAVEGAVAPEATGTGYGTLGNYQTFEVTLSGSYYYLRGLSRGQGVETYTAKNGTSSIYYITSTTTSFTDKAAVDAHAYAEDVYDYYKNTHGRNSYDNAGAKLNSIVHYGSNYNNAFWDGTYMVYGDGDGTTFRTFSAALDVIAHELTHAVTERTAGLVYQNESGALNESISDIFGAMVDRADWLMGEDIYTPATAGDALRSLSNPAAYGDPDHYSKRYTGTQDNGGVHTNSGINNKAAYLLSDGGTHYGVTVTGIGRAATEKIYYRALTLYMTSSTNFSGMRNAAIKAATDLYGATSTQVNSVKQAYSAVGVNL
ncbi:M4 family metallopeptidase [Brevibacillus dissolubilis]|uniref:M4 family metallopeptidase n=1 Tax=Brevibacillus dissolubilis TaxID=1844116 RepID=UPI0011179E20|nr:M4 family metallopeptidase [Brevibacillus dissolubilis]